MADDKCSWSADEIETMLEFIIQKEGYKILDSKRQRNSDLYESVSQDMNGRRYTKTAQQCRTKFEALKSQFLEHKRKTVNKSGQ